VGTNSVLHPDEDKNKGQNNSTLIDEDIPLGTSFYKTHLLIDDFSTGEYGYINAYNLSNIAFNRLLSRDFQRTQS
jgi:hypothetical protein